MAKMLTDDFNGVVPQNIDELQKLPGVGRKTANVIAAVVFNKPVMPVDTHVFRVSARIGLSTNAKTPLAAEKQLVHYIPEHLIPLAHHWLILHGRYICTARSPKCRECGIREYCKYYKSDRAYCSGFTAEFDRDTISRSKDELEHWKNCTISWIDKIEDCRESGEWLRIDNGFNCSRCSYKEICKVSIGMDIDESISEVLFGVKDNPLDYLTY